MRGHHVKNRRDANEPSIKRILEAHGFTVERADQPADLVCGYRDNTFLVEVKNGIKAPLTAAQKKFLETWEGQHVILATDEEATRWAQDIRSRYMWPNG